MNYFRTSISNKTNQTTFFLQILYICSMRIRNILPVLLCLLALKHTQAQTDNDRPVLVEKKRLIDNLFFGGNMGLQFGTITYINLSPVVGYRVSDRVNAGVGLTYIYLSQNFPYGLKDNMIGGKVFGQYFIWNGIFAHTEYEFINFSNQILPSANTLNNGSITPSFTLNNSSIIPPLGRSNSNNFYIGPGYQQAFGRRAFSQIMLLYNVIYDRYNSPYNNPFAIRIMFGF